MACPPNKATFEQLPFKTAYKLRNNKDAVEYEYVLLGLGFIKYTTQTFYKLNEKLDTDQYSAQGNRDAYLVENILFAPKVALYSHAHNVAKLSSIGQTIDESMTAYKMKIKSLKICY